MDARVPSVVVRFGPADYWFDLCLASGIRAGPVGAACVISPAAGTVGCGIGGNVSGGRPWLINWVEIIGPIRRGNNPGVDCVDALPVHCLFGGDLENGEGNLKGNEDRFVAQAKAKLLAVVCSIPVRGCEVRLGRMVIIVEIWIDKYHFSLYIFHP